MYTHTFRPPPTNQSLLHTAIKIVVLANIKAAINDRRNRADLGAQFLLHTPQACSVLLGDKVHRQTQMSETSRTTNTVQVGFTVLGKVKVNDNIHRLNIDTSCEKVCRKRGKEESESTDDMNVQDGASQEKSWNAPEVTKCRVAPLRNSWNTLFLFACCIFA